MKTLFKNGTIFDGSGEKPFVGDVLIEDDRILEVGGSILAEAAGEGRHALIRVSNTVEQPLTKEQCTQLFNRFYRTDPSRNKDRQKGFGIGLSIAAAIAEKHNGTIRAFMEQDRLVIACSLPKEK